MTPEERKQLYDLFWGWVEPDISFLHKQLQEALEAMPDKVLRQFVNERTDDPLADDED